MCAFHTYITCYTSTKPKMNTSKGVLYKTTTLTNCTIPNAFPFEGVSKHPRNSQKLKFRFYVFGLCGYMEISYLYGN